MLMRLEEQMLFPRQYDVIVLDELPPASDVRRFYYPGARVDGGSDGLTIRVQPKVAESWEGVFAFWDRSRTLLEGIFSTPSEDVLCVVSAGGGYMVHADKPQWWSDVPLVPITRVIQIVERDMLIFAGFTSLVAWGREGEMWRTKQLAWDGLQITSIDGDRIVGLGFDPITSANVPFSVNVVTGEHEGGSSPESYEQEVLRTPR